MAETFVECLVTKKGDSKSLMQRIAIVLAICIIPALLVYFSQWAPFLLNLSLPITAAAIWGALILFRMVNLEFEYTVTEAELDIDKIIGRRSRKRLLSIDCRDFEVLAPMNGEYTSQYTSSSISVKIDASSSPKSQDRWFAVFTREGKRTMLMFEPNERMLNVFKVYIRGKMPR